MMNPEEREDEKDSTDDESLPASTSTALTAPPFERLPGKVPGRLKKQNGSCFIR
jgi:hypothetical protein